MNDPRITYYALGELDASAREAFEHELATSTDLQRELKETIALIEALPAATTMNETLTDTARETLRKNAAENLQGPRQNRATSRYVLAGSIAACLAIGATALIFTQSTEVRHLTNPQATFTAQAPTPEAPPPAEATSSSALAASAIATTPAQAKKIPQEVLLAEGGKYAAIGRYDLATKRYEQALKTDKENLPARRGLEQIAKSKQAYQDDVYNQTRAPLTAQVGGKIEIPVGHFTSGKDTAVSRTVIVDQVSDASAAAPASPSRPLVGQVFAGPRSQSLKPSALSLNTPIDRTSNDFNTEAYDSIAGNAFLDAQGNPLSTLSIDVDTASYANVRRFLTAGQLPPAGAVRIEELVNYFPYTYPQPEGDAPFSVTTDVTHAPWNEKHLLARIALKGRDVATDKLPANNLVFLVDVSGSMDEPNKLPLLKRSLTALVEKLSPRDRVAIVVYAGSSGLALPPTAGEDKARILEAIDRLEAGGSTNGAEGIQLAYDIARQQFLKEGNNRVILCTDGDFNVGVTNRSELVRLIENERKSGIFLSVLGFGTGNVKDSQMEQLADKGNGNYAYIDTPSEGRKVLVEQMGATLFTIAKDVKIQVEFNPATVAGYRLIGYENRLLAKEDFNDDTKDAGEIGAGHTVTALYEIVPAGEPLPGRPNVDPLKYRTPNQEAEILTRNPKSKIQNPKSPDLFTVKLRYKAPDGETSKLIEKVVAPEAKEFAQAPEDLRFASAVAAFGMKLRGDKSDPSLDWNAIQKIARGSLGEDPGTYRAEFLTLVQKAKQLSTDEK